MMLVDLGLFFFVLVGSKILLGVVAIYMLLPRETTCTLCDAELIPLEHPRGTVTLLRVLRLQRRWCIECRRESIGRRLGSRAHTPPAPIPVAKSRVR